MLIDTENEHMNGLSEWRGSRYNSLTKPNNEIVDFQKKLVFKELTEENELLQMFALRYVVYCYIHFIEPNRDQLDIDCYDLYSTFLGAFEEIGPTQRLVGTVRIINGDIMPAVSLHVQNIISNLENYENVDLFTRDSLFPIMKTFRVPNDYLTPLNQKRKSERGNKPYEISRLTVLPEYWGAKAKVEAGLHELIILDAWKTKPRKNIFFIATHPRTKRRYKKLGFSIIPGTKERVYKPLKQLAIAMVVNLQQFLDSPNPYREECELIFEFFLNNGYFSKNTQF
ncbi:hypothetical protein ACFL6I_06465 [candidate division KSB1 bacterium]